MPRVSHVMSASAPPTAGVRTPRRRPRVRAPTSAGRARRASTAAKVLLLAPYPSDSAPSQRFRFEQYIAPLAALGYHIELRPLLRPEEHAFLYWSGATTRKIRAVLHGAARRLADLARARSYDFAIVHREAFPLGPPLIETLLRPLGIPFLYDLDDAVYLRNVSAANQRLAALKAPGKAACLARRATLVSAGNKHLAEWARQHNEDVVVIPTSIDTAHYVPLRRASQSGPVCIGWTGSVTTAPYLSQLVGLLAELQREQGVRIRLIGAGKLDVAGADVDALPWQFQTEIADLRDIDIGVMPLSDDEWSRGKCGLKALQYMALGIPTVMSPVGVNSEIAKGGAALLADEPRQWRQALERLINDAAERRRLGVAGRRQVVERYSVSAVLPEYVGALERVAAKARSPRP
jgi:glycosyltransferase involved in cell wall biosynthesis